MSKILQVRRAIDTYAPGGAFLPCIASITCLNAEVAGIIIDESDRYGAEWLKRNYQIIPLLPLPLKERPSLPPGRPFNCNPVVAPLIQGGDLPE